MNIFSDISEYREPTRKEHDKIVRFLERHHFPEKIKEKAGYVDESKNKYIELEEYERKLLPNYLEQVLKGFKVEFRLICKELGYKNKSTTNVSRLTKALNFYLKELCKAKNVDPLIQLFFYHKNSSGNVVSSFDCHLACAEVGKQKNYRRYSYNIVPFKEPPECKSLKNIIHDAGSQTKEFPEEIADSMSHGAKLKYFWDMKEVLKFDSTEKAEWFRKEGPLATDFRAGYIYERKELLGELSKLVFSNNTSILEGNAGLGKSVLVRSLAYNLLEEEKDISIYHYSFKNDPPIFDCHDFLSVLTDIKGLVIIEDIHLATPDMQFIIDKVGKNKRCRILLTARSSFRYNVLDYRPKTLTNLPCMKLKYHKNISDKNNDAKDIDKIIEFYLQKNTSKSFHITNKIRESIKNITEGDLWLLSYALKGASSKGDPLSWLKIGVRNDLNEIEKTGGNPEALLSLSPLFMSEVLTAKSFLIQILGFNRRDVNKLVEMSEITSHEINGKLFYGLSHSSLALAYWEHGDDYRNLLKFSEYEDFVYNYAISGVPNGLQAVIRSNHKTTRIVLNRLKENNRLEKVLEDEQSLSTISQWAVNSREVFKSLLYALHDIDFKLENNKIILGQTKMNDSCKKVFSANVGPFIEVLEGILLHINLFTDDKILDLIAKKLSMHSNIGDVTDCIHNIFTCDNELGKTICNLLNRDKLLQSMYAQDETSISSLLDTMRNANKAVFREFCDSFDTKIISQKYIGRDCDFAILLEIMTQTNETKGKELWRSFLNSNTLIMEINVARDLRDEDVESVFYWLSCLFHANKEMAWDLWGKVNPMHLIKKTQMSVLSKFVCILDIIKSNRDAGMRLFKSLNIKDLLEELSGDEEALLAVTYDIFHANKNAGKFFLSHIDLDDFRRIMNKFEDHCCYSAISHLIKVSTKEIMDLINLELLANTLNVREDNLPEEIECFLCVPLSEMLKLDDLNIPYLEVNPLECISDICNSYAKYGHELCERLNFEELANKLEIRLISIDYIWGRLKIIERVLGIFSKTVPKIARLMNKERYRMSNHKIFINCMKGIEKAHPEFYLKLTNELNSRFSKREINEFVLPDYLNVLANIKE